MKKLVYLIMAVGLVYVGVVTGCKKQSEETPPATPPAAAPEMPSTNAPASTNPPSSL